MSRRSSKAVDSTCTHQHNKWYFSFRLSRAASVRSSTSAMRIMQTTLTNYMFNFPYFTHRGLGWWWWHTVPASTLPCCRQPVCQFISCTGIHIRSVCVCVCFGLCLVKKRPETRPAMFFFNCCYTPSQTDRHTSAYELALYDFAVC